MKYSDAGVNIEAGNELVKRIQKIAGSTRRKEVMTSIGGFAGAVALPSGYKEPLLVSSTDGVGTKLKVAFATGRHDTVGIDLVAMNVNDTAVTGAEPLFFLDYFSCGKLDVAIAEQVIAGIAEGCRQAGCALIGGETAEMPGFYPDGEYDLAGFCVGVVEKSAFVDGSRIEVGDPILGLASTGLHSNGFSLARKIFEENLVTDWDRVMPDLGTTLGEELLKPTRIYAPALLRLHRAGLLRGAAHITGGGLIDNPPRMLRDETFAIWIDRRKWEIPAIFRLLAKLGELGEEELLRTFNLGIGMVIVVPRAEEERARVELEAAGERVFRVGEIVPRRTTDVEFIG